MNDYEKLAIDKYLDQVKVLTSLATALFIAPNLLLSILEKSPIREALSSNVPNWKPILVLTNGAFLLVIILTYLVYSSVVGSLMEEKIDIYRPSTRVFSLLQFLFLTLGCIGLMYIFANAL